MDRPIVIHDRKGLPKTPRMWGWTDQTSASVVRALENPTYVGMDRYESAVETLGAKKTPRMWGWTA